MSDKPVIGVVGVGYVGLTTGACLSHLGYTVVCGDVDEEKINRLRKGEISIVEEGLTEIVNEGITAGRLEFVVGATEVGKRSDIVFLCVPTPQDRDGSADLSFIEAASSEIGPVLCDGAIVVNKSTVPVGTTIVVDEVIQRADIKVVSNPEFLREGTAVNDFLHPDRVVVGADDRGAAENVAALYSSIETEFIITDAASAETIKYAANGFLAMKISFVNSVAAMCEAVGADVIDVVEGIGSDRRIGREFLQPGPGWGGSCFPKDSHSLVHLAETHGYGFSMMRGVIAVNDEQRERMVRKVQRAAGTNDLNGMTISALGLTFKAGTDDLRDSPSLAIIGRLRELGATVRAYDPTTTGRLSRIQESFLEGINIQQSVEQAMREGDVLVILTEWPEFRSLDFEQVKELLSGSAIVDTRNLLDPQSVRAAGLFYDGVGRKA